MQPNAGRTSAMTPEQAREHLALALDMPLPQAEQLYQEVARYIGYVKVGLSLFVEHGPAAVRAFTRQGAKVFLDLKLHDIPNTVQLAAMRAAELGVCMLTVGPQGYGLLSKARDSVRNVLGWPHPGCWQ